jgi:hypothetical protein
LKSEICLVDSSIQTIGPELMETQEGTERWCGLSENIQDVWTPCILAYAMSSLEELKLLKQGDRWMNHNGNTMRRYIQGACKSLAFGRSDFKAARRSSSSL